MAADLGTWPAEQATVLLEVLHASGLHPDARRTRGEVHITVPDEEGDRAHATLVAQMDTIAKAARPVRPTGGSRSGRRLQAVESAGPSPRDAKRRPVGPGKPAKRTARKGTGSRTRTMMLALAALGFGTAFVFASNRLDPTFPLAVMTFLMVWTLGRRAA